MKSLFLSLLLSFCVSQVLSQNLGTLKWLLGEWEMVDGASTTTESWELLNDSTFVGNGITKQDVKVVFQEDLRIEFRNGQVTYVAVLPDKTAYFKLTESSKRRATFEDPENDFPSKIHYELIDSKMEITLFGKQNGENQSMKLSFVKK